MNRQTWIAVVIGCWGVWPLAGAPAADPPAPRKLFAAEPWYQAAEGKEQAFEGLLEKRKSPDGTSGRWNPVRLVVDEKLAREVYLGGDTTVLDDCVGLRVRIVGKPMEVLGHAEIWPGRVEVVTPPEAKAAVGSR